MSTNPNQLTTEELFLFACGVLFPLISLILLIGCPLPLRIGLYILTFILLLSPIARLIWRSRNAA